MASLMAAKSPATIPSKMKAKTSEHSLEGKMKQVDASEPTHETPKRRRVNAKPSALSLKCKNVTASSPETSNQPQLRNKSSAPAIKTRRSEPDLRRVWSTRSSKHSKSPRSPLNVPSVPGLPRSKSSWTLGGSEKKGSVPRFMSSDQARSIRPVRYNPPPKIGEFKLPTITGCTPTRSRFPELEPKQETRSERILNAIKDPKGKMVRKYKGAMKQLSRMEMLKKMHKCLDTIGIANSKRIEYKPLYRLRAIKRASMNFTMSRRPGPLPVAHVERMLREHQRQLSAESTMSRGTSVSSYPMEDTAQDPENSHRVGGQAGSTIVNEEVDEDRTLRESILPFREWLDFLQGNTNPFAEDEGEPFTSPQQPSSPSLPLTQDTLRSLQNLSPTDEYRSHFSSPTSSEITITPANAHTFLAMSSSSKRSSHDPFVDASEVKCTKAGDGNDMPSRPTIIKQSTVQAGESSATGKSEPRAIKALSYRSGNESDTKPPHPSHKAMDTQVRPSSRMSRIPRGSVSIQGQVSLSSEQKEARATQRSRSSIPLATRIHSGERMGSASKASVESFSGGIRVVKKPRGPRPQMATEHFNQTEGSAGRLEMPEAMSSSSGSSVTSEWLAEEENDLQKPPTVFTGEYRTRTFTRSGSRLEAPKLKIAASAEKVLIGSTSKGSIDAGNPHSHPALEHSNSLEDLQKETEDEDATPRALPAMLSSHDQRAKQTPIPRNFCRPHHFGASLVSNPVTPTKTSLGAFSDDIGTGHPPTTRLAPRSVSMQAVADFPLHAKAAGAGDLSSREASSQKRDISQDDLAAKGSARRFGTIRNMFKSSKAASEKAHGRKENEAPGAANKKRSAKISPAQISPPMPLAEEEIPSFARAATTSTRTRAEPPRDGRIRRANLAAMSTGSPQRRVYRRSQVAMPQRISTPSRVIGSAHDVAMVIRHEADASTKAADVGACIEGLVARGRDAAASGKREEYLRLALRLQKQLDEYEGAELAAAEAEAWAATKRSACASAEASLFALYSGVLSHLGEGPRGQ